jgi:hypothetical protein
MPATAQSQSGDGGGRDPYATLCDADVDVIYPCGAGSEQCELIPNGGIPVGFCEGGEFDGVLREVLAGPLESNVTLDATSFGIVTTLAGPDSFDFCRTFAQLTRRLPGNARTSSGIKVCRKVSPGPCPAGGCPTCSDNNYVTTSTSSCVDEAAALAATIAPGLEPEDLAFVAGVDHSRLNSTTAPGLQLKVCASHHWECLNPALAQPGVTVNAQTGYADIVTPGCSGTWITVGGSRYCKR